VILKRGHEASPGVNDGLGTSFGTTSGRDECRTLGERLESLTARQRLERSASDDWFREAKQESSCQPVESRSCCHRGPV
jgi:hypothetical protein